MVATASAQWRTIGEPTELPAIIHREANPAQCLLIDCLTMTPRSNSAHVHVHSFKPQKWHDRWDARKEILRKILIVAFVWGHR